MTANASRVRFALDSALILQDSGQAALTASGASVAQLNLQKLKAYWNGPGEYAINQEFMIVLVVGASLHDSSQSYVVTVRTDEEVAMDNASTVFTMPAITAPGIYYIPIARELLAEVGEADPAFMDVYVTIGGSGTKSFLFYAFAAPFPDSGGRLG
jgi:hypothetical protein